MTIEEILRHDIGKDIDFDRYKPILDEYYRTGKTIVIGPTGSGKTTIPKLIFLKDTENNRYRKLFYLLPTQSLVNAKYEEFKRFAALVPDTPKVSLLSAFSDEKDWFNPLIVSTYDFYYLIRTFQIKYLGRTRQTAAPIGHVVYDELHTFEPLQIAKLVALAKTYGNTMITTATLHPTLRKRIEEELGACTVYLEPFSTHDRVKRIEFIEAENKIEEAVALYRAHKSKKNLIIMNTVGEALEVFKMITGEDDVDRILSEGIIGDVAFLTSATSIGARQKIEKIIESGKLKTIVSTQVAEVGLNYDPDLLITDAAPADALIQRIGRVRSKGNVYVLKETFEEEANSSKSNYEATKLYSGIYIMELIENTFEELQKENINEVLVSNAAAERVLKRVYTAVIPEILARFENGLERAEDNMRQIMKAMKDVSDPFRDNQRYIYFFDARTDDVATLDGLYRATFELDGKYIKNKNFIYKYFFGEIYDNRQGVYFTTISEFKKAVREDKSIFNYEYKVGNIYRLLHTAPEQFVVIITRNADIL